MLRRFLRWWWGELAQLVPGSLSGGEGGQWLCLDVDGEMLRMRVAGTTERDLGQLPLGGAEQLTASLRERLAGVNREQVRFRISVPRGMALSSELELPLAAEENLREVLAFEMSRHTPFRAEDVHFGYRVLARDAARQRCRVALDVVPRSRLAALWTALRDWDLEPESGPAAAREPEERDRIALDFRPAQFRERSYAFVNTVLALVVLALAAFAVWFPVSEQRAYRDELAREIERARNDAAEVAALRERLEARRDARALVASARTSWPSMVVLLEAITSALPDGTYLYRLEATGGEVNLHGSSSAASALIGILEATPHLAAVRFASPVTRDGVTSQERFHIIAELERAPGVAASAASGEG